MGRKLIPTEGFIVLSHAAELRENDLGLLLPNGISNAQSQIEGVVECMGTGKTYTVPTGFGDDIELKQGDLVMVDKARVTQHELDGKAYMIVGLRYVTGILYDE